MEYFYGSTLTKCMWMQSILLLFMMWFRKISIIQRDNLKCAHIPQSNKSQLLTTNHWSYEKNSIKSNIVDEKLIL